jgi:ribonucleoside-triphosphate reductase
MEALMPRQAEVAKPVSLRKRDGRLAAFEVDKIARAVAAAGAATGEFEAAVAQALAEAVRLQLADRTAVDVEQVQDAVERALMAAGYFDTARAYIVYREQRKRVRDEQKVLIDAIGSINEYL